MRMTLRDSTKPNSQPIVSQHSRWKQFVGRNVCRDTESQFSPFFFARTLPKVSTSPQLDQETGLFHLAGLGGEHILKKYILDLLFWKHNTSCTKNLDVCHECPFKNNESKLYFFCDGWARVCESVSKLFLRVHQPVICESPAHQLCWHSALVIPPIYLCTSPFCLVAPRTPTPPTEPWT